MDALTGGAPQRLTAAAGDRTGGMGGKPSPCGKFLAFASDRDLSMPLGLFDLYVVKLGPNGLPPSRNGRFVAPKRLTRRVANQFSRSWSPDSTRLVINSQVGLILHGQRPLKTAARKLSSSSSSSSSSTLLSATHEHCSGQTSTHNYALCVGRVVQVGWTGTAADKVGAGQIITVELDSGRKRAVTAANDKYPALVPEGGVLPGFAG